eukprot:670953-Hanusia_phi.AAC.2
MFTPAPTTPPKSASLRVLTQGSGDWRGRDSELKGEGAGGGVLSMTVTPGHSRGTPVTPPCERP